MDFFYKNAVNHKRENKVRRQIKPRRMLSDDAKLQKFNYQ